MMKKMKLTHSDKHILIEALGVDYCQKRTFGADCKM